MPEGLAAASPSTWRQLILRKQVLAWALYDAGNSAFATSVLVGFFPLFFNQYWSVDADGSTTTARLMTVNGIASLLLALSAPILGAIADRAGWRKPLLAVFAFTGAAATATLFWIPYAAWQQAAVVFGIASIGFAAANIFYDATIVDVTAERRFDRVSAFGFSMGYLAGGLLLAVHLAMISQPGLFGLADAPTAVRVAFLTVAVWWVLFTLPLLFFVHERRPERRYTARQALAGGLAQLAETVRHIRKLRPVALFLVAYWLYIDGVNTIMKLAVDFGYKIGVGQGDLMVALLLVQFIGVPAALGFGWLGERIGARNGLLLGLFVYVVVTSWAGFMETALEFYLLACAIGLAQGGVFSLSRSYFASLIPEGKAAEFFGFYNMIGKFAAVLGPFLVAGAAAITDSTRSAVAAILPLLLLGALMLWVASRAERGRREPRPQ